MPLKPYVDPSEPLTPRFIREQLKELKAHIGCIEGHLADARRRHRRIDTTNRQFGDLEYHLWQIALHSSFIRCKMDLTADRSGSDGKGKQFHEFKDGSLWKCYE